MMCPPRAMSYSTADGVRRATDKLTSAKAIAGCRGTWASANPFGSRLAGGNAKGLSTVQASRNPKYWAVMVTRSLAGAQRHLGMRSAPLLRPVPPQ